MQDSTCTAPWCHQPVIDGFLCQSDTDQARDHLRELAGHPTLTTGPAHDDDGNPAPAPDHGLLADLLLTMTRQDVADPDTTRPVELTDDDEPRTKDRPIGATASPVHFGAGAALDAAHKDLRRWTAALVRLRHGRELSGLVEDKVYRHVAYNTEPRVPIHLNGSPVHGPWRDTVFLPDASSPRELALWMGRHLGDLRQHVDAGTIAAGLDRHVRTARRIVFPETREFLGACDHCRARTDGTAALVDLYVTRGETSVSCPRCGGSWDVRERREWLLDRARDELLPAADVVRALREYVRDLRETYELSERQFPWTADVVKGLGRRGHVAPRGGEKGARFKVGEVMDVMVGVARKRGRVREEATA